MLSAWIDMGSYVYPRVVYSYYNKVVKVYINDRILENQPYGHIRHQ